MIRRIVAIHILPVFITISLILVLIGQIGRLSFNGGLINIHISDPIIAITTFALAIYIPLLSTVKKTKLILSAFIYFFVFLFVSLVGSFLFFSVSENIIASAYFFRLFVYHVFLIGMVGYAMYLYKSHSNTRVSERILFYKSLFLLSVIYLVFVSILQLMFYPNLRNLEYAGWDVHLLRVFSVFFEPVVAGAIFGIVGLTLFFFPVSKGWRRTLKYIILTSLLVLIILTFSRAVILSIIIVVTIHMVRTKRWKMLASLIVLTAVSVTLYLTFSPAQSEGQLLTRTSSIEARLNDYVGATQLARLNPISGIGYNHIGSVKQELNPDVRADNNALFSFHSTYLIVLVTGGVIGLVLYFFFVFSIIQLNTYSMYVIQFLVIASMFDNLLFHPFILLFTGFCMFIAYFHNGSYRKIMPD